MTCPRTTWTIAVAISTLLATCVSADPPQPEPEVTFDSARRTLLEGDFETAIEAYEVIAQSGRDRPAAILGLAEIDLLIGEYERGIERLLEAQSLGEESADWHAAYAALLVEIGKYADAEKHNRRAISLDDEHLRARWQLGQCLEAVGRMDEAIRVYEPFEEIVLGGDLPETPENVTWLGCGFYRYSLLTRHPNLTARTRHVLQEIYQDAFDNLDPLYWPARLAAAELLLDKHNTIEARIDLDDLIDRNPHVSDAYVALGYIELENWNFEAIEERVKEARKTNPRSVPATLLLADCRMLERRYEEAIETANEALGVNPNCVDAMAVVAAARMALGDAEAAERIQKQAEKINPRPARFHYAMGIWLTARRQFDRAEAEYKKAIALAPWWPEPVTDLGLAYLETGEEALAKETLEASFKLDGFNHRTHTILAMLDQLEKMATTETEHFIVKFDKKADPVIGMYFSQALEAMYADICDLFDHHPKKKTIVELFPSHVDFSVRIAGRPFISTIGACSGRVIAMASPRPDASLFGRYNWDTVLRHEFTHTVTLDATKGRIPHWYTEACAVFSEPQARSWSRKHLLSENYREDRLFSLEEIDWGFVRPKRSDGRSLAYAQSEWMLEYIIEKYGMRKANAMLKAYRDELPQKAVFKKVLGTDTTSFFEAFKQWAGKQVSAWDVPLTPSPDLEEIETQLEAEPENAALHAQLAAALLAQQKVDEAEDAAKKALSLDPKEKTALEIYTHIQVGRSHAEKDTELRKKHLSDVELYLRRLIRLDPKNPHAIKYMGFVEQSHGHWTEAIDWMKRYQERYPDDPDSYRRLAAIYRDMDDKVAQIDQLSKLALMVDDNPYVAVQLAEVCENAGHPKKAAKWYRHAMRIDPFDVSMHLRCGDVLLLLGRPLDARQDFEAAIALEPGEGKAYDGLSRVFAAIGNQERAEAYKKEAEARGFRREAESPRTTGQ